MSPAEVSLRMNFHSSYIFVFTFFISFALSGDKPFDISALALYVNGK
jgi:hypothetical protein